MINEYYSLQPPDVLEKNPFINKLKQDFEEKLPPHFGNARFIPSPVKNLNHVLRADCKSSNCRARAVVHVIRSEQSLLEIKEKVAGQIDVQYDRTGNCCSDCEKVV